MICFMVIHHGAGLMLYHDYLWNYFISIFIQKDWQMTIIRLSDQIGSFDTVFYNGKNHL